MVVDFFPFSCYFSCDDGGVRMNRLFLSAVFACGIFSFSGSFALADFYSYTDDSGEVHITNVPTSGDYVLVMKERKRPAEERPSPEEGNIEEMIRSASEKYGIDPVLVKAIVKAESDFESGAVSEDGARGLMQLMPETARLMGVSDIDDPRENIEGGTRYLSKLLNDFNFNLRLAVAAYNAGESAVRIYGAVPPYVETQNYVKKVLHYYDAYRGQGE